MKISTIRKGLYKRVDEMIDGPIATAIVVGSTLVVAAVLKAAVVYLIR